MKTSSAPGYAVLDSKKYSSRSRSKAKILTSLRASARRPAQQPKTSSWNPGISEVPSHTNSTPQIHGLTSSVLFSDSLALDHIAVNISNPSASVRIQPEENGVRVVGRGLYVDTKSDSGVVGEESQRRNHCQPRRKILRVILELM